MTLSTPLVFVAANSNLRINLVQESGILGPLIAPHFTTEAWFAAPRPTYPIRPSDAASLDLLGKLHSVRINVSVMRYRSMQISPTGLTDWPCYLVTARSDRFVNSGTGSLH